MKTKYVAYTIIILSIVGIYFSLDLLSGLRLVVENESGQKSIDSFSTSQRFLELWPITLILGLVIAVLISAFFLWALETVRVADIEELKTKLDKEIEDCKKVKDKSILEVIAAEKRADNAFDDAYKQVESRVKDELENIELKTQTLKNEKLRLDNRESELERRIEENNMLMLKYQQDAKQAKQKAQNHGNALSRKKNMINRLKNDVEYLNSFIKDNYNT